VNWLKTCLCIIAAVAPRVVRGERHASRSLAKKKNCFVLRPDRVAGKPAEIVDKNDCWVYEEILGLKTALTEQPFVKKTPEIKVGQLV